MKPILITGGAGYIGSHIVQKLLKKGYPVVVLDDLSRGHRQAVPRKVILEKINLLDERKVNALFAKYSFTAVMHFAGYAFVGESVSQPALYYRNNVIGSLNLLNAMVKQGVKKIVFSSSCSVYGNPVRLPISEKETLKPISPYARTKLLIEQMLADYSDIYKINYVSLRYFNAAGADWSGQLGESHKPEPHLIPLVIKAALGKGTVRIFGTNYQTKDGTCIRDYIHVSDLAEAHFKALTYLNKSNKSIILNLGTGRGYSVKEVVQVARQITGRNIKTKVCPRRLGDPAVLVADNKKAKKILHWTPHYDLNKIIRSALQWHQNPKY